MKGQTPCLQSRMTTIVPFRFDNSREHNLKENAEFSAVNAAECNSYRHTTSKKKETMYLPFDATSPRPASDDLDGPDVDDSKSPPCTRNAFSRSAV